MKRLHLAALFVLIAASLSAQETMRMSLNEAIDYAIKHQPAFQNYRIDQQVASAKSLEATSKYIPKLSGSFDMRDNLKLGEIALKLPAGLNPNGSDVVRIQQGTKYIGTGGVDLSVPVVDASAITDIKYAKEQQKLSSLKYDQALVDLKMNVSRIYYTVLLNRERVKKAEKTVERNQKAYDDTKVRYDNQNALKTDLNRAYLNLSNAKYQLKVAKDSIKTTGASLALAIGLPLNSTIEPSDSLPMQLSTEALPEYPDFKAAEDARVELKAENQQKNLNTLMLKKTDSQYIPSLSGYGFIGGQGLDNDKLFQKSSWYWNSYIGIRLTVPIFDGLQKSAIAQQQKLSLKINENNINSIKQNINYQLQTSLVNYSNANYNLQLIKDNVALAEDVVKDVHTRYTNSVATYQDVLDAENTLKETEFNYLQALYAYLLAELDWKKANGKL